MILGLLATVTAPRCAAFRHARTLVAVRTTLTAPRHKERVAMVRFTLQSLGSILSRSGVLRGAVAGCAASLTLLAVTSRSRT